MPDGVYADLIVGKKILVTRRNEFIPSRSWEQDEFEVTRFRRALQPDETREHLLFQFWAAEGGMRTVAAKDITVQN